MSNTNDTMSDGGIDAGGTTAVAEAPPPATGAAPAPALARGGPSPFWRAVKRVLRQPRFVAAAAVLAVSAVGLNAATQFLQLHFRKQPVSLRVPGLADEAKGLAATLDGESAGAGQWVLVSRDEPMKAEVEESLGTKEHLDRDYVDVRALGTVRGVRLTDGLTAPAKRAAAVAALRDEPARSDKRAQFLGELMKVAPEAVVHVHVAYYTGLVDTVAHIPDRCYLADGFETSVYDRVSGPFGRYADGTPRDADFRFIQFEDQTGQNRGSRFVGYLFHVNGQYESNPLMVRKHLQDLFERYGYYAKVELMVASNQKDAKEAKAKATKAMSDFMAAALPDVERMLPDWRQVKAGAK